MSEVKVTMTELRQSLGELINRAAYGGEHIILVSHGSPKAAIISVEELGRLYEFHHNRETQSKQVGTDLTGLDELRQEIAFWQKEHGVEPDDSVQILREIREERDEQLLGLR